MDKHHQTPSWITKRMWKSELFQCWFSPVFLTRYVRVPWCAPGVEIRWGNITIADKTLEVERENCGRFSEQIYFRVPSRWKAPSKRGRWSHLMATDVMFYSPLSQNEVRKVKTGNRYWYWWLYGGYGSMDGQKEMSLIDYGPSCFGPGPGMTSINSCPLVHNPGQ